jgi:hypothetical protein
MLKEKTVEFHQARVEITRLDTISNKQEKFFALPTISVDQKANPTELDFCEQAHKDWANPAKPISLVTFETHHGIQSATRKGLDCLLSNPISSTTKI